MTFFGKNGATPKELQETYKEFKRMRTKIKKPMTEKAEEMLLNKLMKLSKEDITLAIKLLEQSIYHCWLDVYDLKTEKVGTGKASSPGYGVVPANV